MPRSDSQLPRAFLSCSARFIRSWQFQPQGESVKKQIDFLSQGRFLVHEAWPLKLGSGRLILLSSFEKWHLWEGVLSFVYKREYRNLMADFDTFHGGNEEDS